LIDLTQEQEFEIAKMKTYVGQIPRQNLEEMLLSMITQNMVTRNCYLELLKKYMGASR